MGGKSSTISTSEQRILSLQVQQSSQGLTLPVVYGRTRIAGNLVWYGDFTAIEHTTTTRSGKGGGGVTQKNTTYTYEAAIAMALCEGPIKRVVSVWRDKQKFEGDVGMADLRLSVAKGTHGQGVWSHLSSKHPKEAIGYSDTAYVRSSNYELTNGAQIYSHNFEIDGKLGYSDVIPDANPRDILKDLLTNQNYGCGFPESNMGDTDVYSTYCRALGLFLSPAYSEQSEAQENIAELLTQTNSAAVFSEGRLKIVPYGDAPASGNGAVYAPNLTPLYDLTDDDFIGSGDDPIQVDRKTNADAYNQVQIEYLDRDNDYNIAVAEAKDQANIEKYGLRPQDAVQMHAVCDKAVAQQIAQLTLQRALYVRNEYSFKLGWKYILLEPMDLVTITDETLGLDKTPVRIIEIEEDEDGGLSVKAEDFPFGSASATQYPTQPNLGYSADYNTAPGNAFTPAMFEAPLQLTNNEPQIWLATAGGDNWGGCEVWVSTDGDSYKRAGTINNKARYGSLASPLAAGAVYDNVNVLDVAVSAGALASVSEQDARDLLSACYVDGEFLAYTNAQLKGVGQYALSKLVRGAYGSSVGAHEAGRAFVRMDDALFRYTFDRKWLGKTVWVKLVSYNIYGSGIQNLAEVPAYSYKIIGAPLGQVTNLRLTSAWSYGKNASIAWDKLDGADSYDVEVYAAASQVRLRLIEGVVDNQFTYTLADMKADGGQVRDVVFRVRGRAVTSKTGAWSQVVAQNPQLKALTGTTIEEGLNQAFFKCNTPDEEDFAGLRAWVSTDAACPIIAANLAYDGADTFIALNKCNGKALESGTNYYLRVAGYDSFDKSSLNVSSPIKFNVYGVDAVAKELSESNLAASLKSRIDLIDGTGAGSVHAQISEAKTTILSAIETEVANRTRDIKATADKSAADLLAKATELGTKITAVENVNATQAQQIQTVTAAQGQTAAGLEAEKKARADGDTAEASKREALAARTATAEGSIIANKAAQVSDNAARVKEINALGGRVGTAESAINTLRETVTKADEARATEIQTLKARTYSGANLLPDSEFKYGLAHHTSGEVNWPNRKIGFNLSAMRTIEGKKVGYIHRTESSDVTLEFARIPVERGRCYQVSCYVQQATSNISGTTIYCRPLVKGAWDATGVSYKTIQNTVVQNGTRTSLATMTRCIINVKIAADAPTEQISVALALGKTSDTNPAFQFFMNPMICEIPDLDAAAVPYSPGPDPTVAATEAAFTEYKSAQASADAVTATEVKRLAASVNGNTAVVQAQATSINGLEAQYTVKVDVNGHVSGYGLATTAVDGAPKSQFIVSANQFGIGATGASTAYPFTVDTDTNTVGVNGALVVNGKAIIDKLNAGDITGDKLAAGSVTASRLVAGTLTSREIGAKSVTADKMNVTSLSAVSANMGDVTAGTVTGITIKSSSINNGNGNFTVDSSGNLYAKNGRFEGTIRADRIEGFLVEQITVNRSNITNSYNGVVSSYRCNYVFEKIDARSAYASIETIESYARANGSNAITTNTYVRVYLDGVLIGGRSVTDSLDGVDNSPATAGHTKTGIVPLPAFRVGTGEHNIRVEIYGYRQSADVIGVVPDSLTLILNYN